MRNRLIAVIRIYCGCGLTFKRVDMQYLILAFIALLMSGANAQPQQPLQPLPPYIPAPYVNMSPRYYVPYNRFEQPPPERLNRYLKRQWREIRTFNFGDTECVVISENNIQCGKRFW